MKNFRYLVLGALAATALPFLGLVVGAQAQLGPLGRAPAEEGGPLMPPLEPGQAVQGREVYLSLGCVSCHTQQVRPAGQGRDIAGGLGARPSVARDYVLQPVVLLGDRRRGPDLANYGARIKDDDGVHRAILHRVEGRDQFAFLYSGAKHEVPSDRAIALAAYLRSLRQDYPSPEAPLK
ncbi:MAG: cbb3-type cytochrome c oxidase subunit II [Opitutales bacterium]